MIPAVNIPHYCPSAVLVKPAETLARAVNNIGFFNRQVQFYRIVIFIRIGSHLQPRAVKRGNLFPVGIIKIKREIIRAVRKNNICAVAADRLNSKAVCGNIGIFKRVKIVVCKITRRLSEQSHAARLRKS